MDLGRGSPGGLPRFPTQHPSPVLSPSPSLHIELGQPSDTHFFLCQMWKQRSDPVLHIDLRRWADLMLVAPLDANTLGKVASGICDNLLVSDSLCPPPALGLAPNLLSCRLPLHQVLALTSCYGGPVCSEHCPLPPTHLTCVRQRAEVRFS